KASTAGQVGTYTFNKGVTTINYTVTDAAGNTTTGSKTVTVTDNENPTVTAASDVVTTTSADSPGNCTVSRAIPDATNADNCSVTKLTWALTGVTSGNSPATGINQVGTKIFNIGVTTITYIVTDGNGRTSTDSMTVTVTDDENPSISCPSDQNVNFGANCQFILLDYTALAVASDNCSTPIVTQSPAPGTPISGQTTVTLTATDSANNKSTCTFEVIPTDNEPPTAICKNITVNLSASGTVNINAIDLNNGSTDNCGVVKYEVSPNSFNCSNVGANTVIFTVFDDAGNSDSCTATVTVVDNTPPTMLCNNFVVVVDPITRVATIKVSDIDNGSNDVCGIASLTLSPSVFPEDTNGNVYTTLTTLTAVDVNGNSNTCTATVTVEPPVNQFTYLTGVIVDPIPTYPQPASALIEATACPGGLYDPKDVQFTLNAIGTYDLQASDVLHWEYSEDNGETWTVIPNTAGLLTYTLLDIIKNTFVRLSIMDADDASVIKTSATAFVRFLPPDEPPTIVSYTDLDICLGESVTVVAESFFDQPGGQFGAGGEFNYAQPDGWRVDYLDGYFPASGDTGSQTTWKETNSNNNATFSGINYDTTDNTKFAMAHGVGNTTTLETPVFSTVGMTSSEAILTFDTSYFFCNNGYGEIWLSFDSGVTYTKLLTTIENYDFDSRTGGTTTTGVILNKGTGNKCIGQTYPRMVSASIDLGTYAGLSGLRVKFEFNGSTSSCGTASSATIPNPNNVNCNNGETIASGWAIDGVGFAFAQVDDELEWTDEGGTVIQVGTTATVTPVTPGIRRYGVTTLINGCRTDDDSGTNFIDITTSLAYAGEDYLPVAGNCGEATLKLNAYDNTKKAIENYNKGAWINNLYVVPADASQDFAGTGVTGQWSIVSSSLTSTCGSSATFSSNTDPDAVFTGNPGTYTLRWTLTNGCFDEIDVKISDCNSLDFDGANDYVTFKNNFNLNSAFSIETWIKPNSITGTRTIISRKDASDNTSGYDLSIVNGQVRFNWYYSTGSGSVTSAAYSIDTSRWYHLAVTFDGSIYKLYVDGIELGLINNNNPPNLTGNNIEALIGAMYQVSSGVPVNYYHGWVDEFKIWNKALSVEHIRQMMNQEIDELGADVGGVVIPTKIYGPDNGNDGIEDNPLLWNNLEAYYRMIVICGDIAPYKKGVNGRLRNITSSQEQTAPIPYTSTTTGVWDNKDTWNNKTIWTTKYVWDAPNSTGVNGTPIDWNIVKISHNINSGNKDITVLGLISDTSNKTLTIADPTVTTPIENNDGQGLWITHYLKLNGIIDLVGESQLVQKRYGTYDASNNFSTTQFSESIFDEASTGYIERDQQGQKNSFNYNYWSSPVTRQGAANNASYKLPDVLRDGTNSANPGTISFVDGAYSADGTLSSPIKITSRWIWTYRATIGADPWANYYQWSNVGYWGSI
ncbi:MAG: LamG-like jellyroll fold domain-containing protein, partial [Lutibacter sp.]